MEQKYGPKFDSVEGKNKFFSFYKRNKSRALVGFLKDVAKSENNAKRLAAYLRKRKNVNCLIMGSSYWSNPRDTINFLKKFNKNLNLNLAALDVLADALLESTKHGINFMPLITPAQNTPFLDDFFDIIVCDCLLTCCSFDQHEPVVKEMSRIIKKNGLLLLGIVHSEKNITFKMMERPIMCYSRPLGDYVKLFNKYKFTFPSNSSIETRLPGEWSKMKITNGIVLKK